MRLDEQTNFESVQKSFSNSKDAAQKMFFPAWTGLNDKTMWDVLQFICTAAVPIVLALWSAQQANISREQDQQSQSQNEDNQRARIMSEYLDAMTKYLLEDATRSPVSSKANMIARARTLNTLRQLDPKRKGQLLKFLYEASLVNSCQIDLATGKMLNCPVSKLGLDGARLDTLTFDPQVPLPGIDLTGASLMKAELPGIDLNGALLEKANLEEAKLQGADLTQAHLQFVVLKKADLTNAVLEKADLTNALLLSASLNEAKLGHSILKGADLSNASLIKTDLRDADLTNVTLTETSNFQGAIYNQQTKFPAKFNPVNKGMIRQN